MQVSQVPDRTVRTRRPSVPRHVFHAINRVWHFFSASRRMRTLATWVLNLTRRNSEGSLALRLIRLYGRAPAVESPLLRPAILSDCRFLIRVGSFHPTSSCRALLGARGVEPSASAFADAEAPSSNRTCRFPAYGFPCETGIIGLVPLSLSG